MATIYYGPVINPQSLTDYLALPRCLILISSDGDIDRVYEDVQSSQLQDIIAQSGYADLGASFIQLKEGQFLMPGLIDTHTVRPRVISVLTTLIIFSICSTLVKSLTSACKSWELRKLLTLCTDCQWWGVPTPAMARQLYVPNGGQIQGCRICQTRLS